MAYEIECGKFSYTDFSSLSNAPEAHGLKPCALQAYHSKRIHFRMRFFITGNPK
jgi:hypothetical protein